MKCFQGVAALANTAVRHECEDDCEHLSRTLQRAAKGTQAEKEEKKDQISKLEIMH